MTAKDWDTWLKDWLKGHPLRMPAAQPDRRFTEEVMAKIRAEQSPAPVILRWIPRPRFAFALGGTLAAVLALTLWIPWITGPLLRQIERDSEILFEAGELWAGPHSSPEEEWEEYDRIVLAQTVKERGATSEEQEPLQLWEELEKLQQPPSAEEAGSAEDLSDELEWLDQMELTLPA